MLVLREADIRPILYNLTLDQCLHLLRTLWGSLANYSHYSGSAADGQAQVIYQPMREVIRTARQNTTLFMPASDTNTTTGIKIVTLPGGGGAPRGAINIFSPDGTLEGVLNAELVTAFRTALASMIPFSRHKLPGETHVLVFGAGKQAEWHIRLALLLSGSSVTHVTVINRGRLNLENLKSDLDAELTSQHPDVVFEYISRDVDGFEDRLRASVRDADAIFCCTPSTEPLFPHSYLRQSRHQRNPRLITLIGSYRPDMKEVDSDTLLSGGKILVDSKEACLEEAGELIAAGVGKDQLVEIGELMNDPLAHVPGHLDTVFKCVGMGIMDIVIGRELLHLAKGIRVGISIDGF
ncbi:hypothetical protein FQN57_000246 [Myotisia sp. PD_48]|nr:hypothetical protein FQN57_000246 [Myotisia sp. PD_48]